MLFVTYVTNPQNPERQLSFVYFRVTVCFIRLASFYSIFTWPCLMFGQLINCKSGRSTLKVDEPQAASCHQPPSHARSLSRSWSHTEINHQSSTEWSKTTCCTQSQHPLGPRYWVHAEGATAEEITKSATPGGKGSRCRGVAPPMIPKVLASCGGNKQFGNKHEQKPWRPIMKTQKLPCLPQIGTKQWWNKSYDLWR